MVTAPAIDWNAFRDRKQERFAVFMADRGLDHVVVSGFDNFRWLIDHQKGISWDSGHDYYLAIVGATGQTTVIACDVDDERETPFPAKPWITRYIAGPSWSSFWSQGSVVVPLLVRELRALGVKRVGLEIAHFELVDALRQELPDVEFVPIAWDLLELRKVKLDEEIALLEHAAKVSSIGMVAGLNAAQEGVTDQEIVRHAAAAMYDNGAEIISHHFITVDSSGGGLHQASGNHVWKGAVVKMDLGCYTAGGYAGDLCRCRFVGDPDPRVAEAYRILIDALEAGVSTARPGTRCSELTATINGALSASGYPTSPYAMGHGIGVRVMELPVIYRPDLMRADDPLEAGMVICLEPSTTVDVDGAVVKVANEETYVVEEDGLRQITPPGLAI